jgi:pimeloyl-ACP methyl ester carboxylesterase
MAVRAGGRDVPLDGDGLAEAFPDATGRVVVLLHGLCENESHWSRWRERTGTTYGEMLAGEGWTPVFLRANTGLGLRENGVALSALMQQLVEAWPVPVSRVALVGHSMGGLIFRAAGAVASDVEEPWTGLVSDVVTLGTPHLGAPIARGIGHGSRGMARLPETAPFGRILDWRSLGVHDLVAGLAEDVPPLPHARYRLVAATVTAGRRHPVGHVVGDLLVRVPSAYGRDRHGQQLFPGATVLHVGRTDHFGLLNHPEVHRALREWLA